MDDLNQELARQIMDDCRQAREPSSYETTAGAILNRTDFKSDEQCVVIALPGIDSTAVPPSTEEPDAVILRERVDGKGTAYLRLRREQVLLETYSLGIVDEGSRYLVLYIFEDAVALDMITATEHLQMSMWAHEMSAQSRHFFDDETSSGKTVDAFQLPVVIRRAINVIERAATDEDDLAAAIKRDDEDSIPF
ncbi:hypothetical protein [Paraburkholderia caribensis]|uniref:hypothetical protein n=1 Tax=Paraburkholderia caribensis TaxID=75105 RepID=UPI00159079C3|nr:hypothetical protein [Paraburkholderia caribensis]